MSGTAGLCIPVPGCTIINAKSGSGGVAIGITRDLARSCKAVPLEGDPDGILCVRMSKEALALDKDLMVLGVYIPPAESTYVDQRATQQSGLHYFLHVPHIILVL